MRSAIWWLIAVVEAIAIAVLAVAIWSTPDGGASPPTSDPSTSQPDQDARADAASGTPEARQVPATDAPAAAPDARAAAAPPAPTDRTTWTGRIVDQDGADVPESRMWVYGTGDRATERLTSVSVGRYSRGRFALPGLETGSYRVQVRAKGFPDTDHVVEIPPNTAVLRHDLRIERAWTLRVAFVTPEGQPLHDVLVDRAAPANDAERYALTNVNIEALATRAAPPSALPTTDLRSSPLGLGNWRSGRGFDARNEPLPPPWAGTLELPDRRPTHVSAVVRTAVLATQLVSPDQDELRFELDAEDVLGAMCSLRLQVVDAATGEPVAGARVSLTDAQSGEPGIPTGADGVLLRRFLRPGTLQLFVQGPDGARAFGDVRLEPGQLLDLGSVPLPKPVEVRFRAEDLPPDADLRFGLRGLDEPAHPGLTIRASIRAKRDGDLLTATVPAGRHRFVAAGSGVRAEAEFDTAVLDDRPVPMRFAPTASVRILVPEAGDPFELTFTDGSGRVRYRNWISWSRPFEAALPPGSYTVATTGLDGAATSRTLEVGTAGTTLDLR